MSKAPKSNGKKIAESDVAAAQEKILKAMTPFSLTLKHKDTDGQAGDTTFTMNAPTTLGAQACLREFEAKHDEAWKRILVQELFDPAEADMINEVELNRRVVDRIASESPTKFRVGTLVFTYEYEHPFLKGVQKESLTIEYKYNQLLHLIQMVNTVMTKTFADQAIEQSNAELAGDESAKSYQIKL